MKTRGTDRCLKKQQDQNVLTKINETFFSFLLFCVVLAAIWWGEVR